MGRGIAKGKRLRGKGGRGSIKVRGLVQRGRQRGEVKGYVLRGRRYKVD